MAWTDDARLPARLRAAFCLTLATNAGRFSSAPPAAWAQRALGEFRGQLRDEVVVQMMTTAFDASDGTQVCAILAEITAAQERRRAALPPLTFMREAALRSDVMNPYLVRCLAAGHVGDAVRGLGWWYRAEHAHDGIDVESVLLTAPFGEHGYTAAVGPTMYQVSRDSQSLLERVTHLTNRFLGAAQTVAYADNSQLALPERPGVPDMDAGTEWFAALQETYCPAGAQIPGDAVSCQLALPCAAHPLQGVQLATWGVTWPIAASLSRPRPDRAVRSVALWSGGGGMTEGMEIEMLRVAFAGAGAAVDVFQPETCSAEDFIEV